MTLSSLSTTGLPPPRGCGPYVVRIEQALCLQDPSMKFSAKWSHPVGVLVSSQKLRPLLQSISLQDVP